MRKFLPLLLAVLFVTACTTDFKLNPGEILTCQTEDYTGYIIPTDGDGDNHALLYIDIEGELFSQGLPVQIEQRGEQTYISGQEVARQACLLTPYQNPAERDCPEGIDYCEEIYSTSTTSDVIFAQASGYWSSYPNRDEPFLDTYLRKIDDILFRRLQNLTMDIYQPQDDSLRLRPLLVMIHGGAFFNGDKADEEYRLWCQKFAACGYVAISVNYRLGFSPLQYAVERAGYRAVQDVHAAIRYMLAHQSEYRVDADRIFVAGCSAGAITALNIAFMTEENRPESTREILLDSDLGPMDAVSVHPDYREPFAIRSVANMWGALSDLSMLETSATSVISFHGVFDPVVPFGKGKPFRETVGIMIEHQELPFGDFFSYLGRQTVSCIVPTVYGSSKIHEYAQQMGKRSKLQSYEIERHTLVRDEQDFRLNHLHQEIFDSIACFFRDDMADTPVVLRADGDHIYIEDPSDVAVCSWTATNGLITEALSDASVRALLFSDSPQMDISQGDPTCQGSNAHTVTVSGLYRCGVPFCVTLDLSAQRFPNSL